MQLPLDWGWLALLLAAAVGGWPSARSSTKGSFVGQLEALEQLIWINIHGLHTVCLCAWLSCGNALAAAGIAAAGLGGISGHQCRMMPLTGVLGATLAPLSVVPADEVDMAGWNANWQAKLMIELSYANV